MLSVLLTPVLGGCFNFANETAPPHAAAAVAWYSGEDVNPDPMANARFNFFDLEDMAKSLVAGANEKGVKPVSFTRSDADSHLVYHLGKQVELLPGEGAALERSGKRPWKKAFPGGLAYAPKGDGPIRLVFKDAHGFLARMPGADGGTLLVVTIHESGDDTLRREAESIR